jgi:recombination protein RecA
MVERIRSKAKDPKPSDPGEGGSYFARPNQTLTMIPSGSKLLDLALGGGWAKGRVSNVIGDKASGKTLLAIEACNNFCRMFKDGKPYYRESESAFDKPYAEALGMPLDRIDFGSKPFVAVEDMFDELSDVTKEAKHGPIFYVCDSLDALSDRGELERDMDEGSYGAAKAKKLSEMFRRVIQPLEDAGVTLFIISQIRDKVGALAFQRKWTRTGGKALDFYSSQILFLIQEGLHKREKSGIERVVGVNVHAKMEKNKIGLPYREANFKIIFGFGIDDVDACLKWLKAHKSIELMDLKDADIPHYKQRLEKMPDAEYWVEVKRLYTVVQKRWYEVETDFLPTRKKYV